MLSSSRERTGGGRVEVRLLGPVELWGADREVPLGGPQQRTVLAALAIAPRQPVAVDDLVLRVWGDRRPGDARNVLQTHVSRLRGLLVRAGGDPRHRVVQRCGDAYLLAVEPEQVDLCRARALATDARDAAGDGPAGDESAAGLLRRATDLRRSRPLSGLRGSWAEQTRASIDQEWLAWQIERFDIELRLERPGATVGLLSTLLATHPHDEELARLLMLALYRCGRPGEALAVYAGFRRRLIERLGDEPGRRLRRLHQQVLRRDPALDDSHPSAPVLDGSHLSTAGPDGGAARVRPAQLPPDVGNLIGRAAELRQLNTVLGSGTRGQPVAATVALVGMAGIGKTALAVHWGHLARDSFPDGQLYVDLCGFAPGLPRDPAGVLAQFLRSLGVPADQVPAEPVEAAGLYRSLLAERTVLVVLDNAADSAQVRPLLPGAGRSVAVVTSRATLPGLQVREGVHRLELDLLTEAQSSELVSALLVPDAGAAGPAAVAELVRRCGRLPLALRVATAVLGPSGRVAELVERLREKGALRVLSGLGEAEAQVPAVFDLSYARISAPAQRAFRLLGLVPGVGLTADVVAALAGVPPAQAEPWLAELVRAHLVRPVAPGRYVCHDLLREYAADRADRDEPEEDREAALGRLYDYYLGSADAATRLLYPGLVRLPAPGSGAPAVAAGFREPADALAWLEAERVNLVAATERAAAVGRWEAAWRLADAVRPHLFHGMFFADGRTVAEAGLAAATSAGDLSGQAAARLQLATLLCYGQDRYPEAIEHASQMIALCQECGWLDGQGAGHNLLGHACVHQGELEQAVEHFERAAALTEQTGSDLGKAAIVNNLGSVYFDLGRLQPAAGRIREAAALFARAGSPSGQAVALINLGQIHRLLGEFTQALDCFNRAVEICRPIGDRPGEASGRKGAAEVHRDTGHYHQALAAAEAALAIARDTGRLELEADCLRVQADVLGERGKHQEAMTGHQEAVELAGRAGYHYVEADARVGLAWTYHRLGELGPAAVQAGQALVRARASGMRIAEGRALAALAAIRLDQGETGAAIRSAEAALANHRETGHRLGAARALLTLAAAHHRLGALQEAERYRSQARARLAELGVPPADTGGATA
jgi:DNA-binding SARP family transcriptional activator/tetratricopeptide (TPR) repeat protein